MILELVGLALLMSLLLVIAAIVMLPTGHGLLGGEPDGDPPTYPDDDD